MPLVTALTRRFGFDVPSSALRHRPRPAVARSLHRPRASRNDFSARWHGREAELRQALPDEAPRYAAATSAGDFGTAVV